MREPGGRRAPEAARQVIPRVPGITQGDAFLKDGLGWETAAYEGKGEEGWETGWQMPCRRWGEGSLSNARQAN